MSAVLLRAAFVPVAVMLAVVTLLVAVVSFFGLYHEFEYSRWIVDRRTQYGEQHLRLPAIMDGLRAVYPLVWALPLGVVTVAALLCRRAEVSLVSTAWFVSTTVVVTVAWILYVVVAFWSLHTQGDYM